jgi:TetR/AcrR family transcriptional regulator, tetracycline repressor protein
VRLTRDAVLAGAIELLDEVGLESLSMRRLSAHLGVQNGATYWHFPHKQALLEAMANAILAGVTDDLDRAAPWHEQLAQLAGKVRAALLAHRDGARVVAGAFAPEPNALAYGEAAIAILVGRGLSHREAAWGAGTISNYVVAQTIDEQAAEALPDHGRSHARRLAEVLADPRFPHTRQAMPHIVATPGDEHFAYGLGLIIDGLRRRVEARAS